MATTMPAPGEIVAALRDYRCTVHQRAGWENRGARDRTGRLRPFAPYAQAWHHDALNESVSDARAAELIFDEGRPDLSPPLANGTIGSHGVVELGAYHNANHAGWNEADVHARLKAGLAPLGDARSDPDTDSVIGNTHLWGWECRNAGDGRDPWDQLDVMMRAGAALCDVFGWPAAANAGHRELTARKIDPRGFDMFAFRAGIADALKARLITPLLEDPDMTVIRRKSTAQLDPAKQQFLLPLKDKIFVGHTKASVALVHPTPTTPLVDIDDPLWNKITALLKTDLVHVDS